MSWIGTYSKLYLIRRPRLMTAVFLFLKRLPKFNPLTLGLALTNHEARAILARGRDFEVGPTSAPKMLEGDFIHGMDKFPRYEIDRAELAEILYNKKNLEKLKIIVQQIVEQTIALEFADKNIYDKKFDLFGVFVQPIVTESILSYYGIDDTKLKSSVLQGNHRQLSTRITRIMGTLIAMQHPAPFGRYQVASKVHREYRQFLIQNIKQQLSNSKPVGEGTIIQQLIYAENKRESDENIVVEKVLHRLSGILATSTAINKIFINVLQELIRRRDSNALTEREKAPLSELKILAKKYMATSNSAPNYEKDRADIRTKVRGYILELLRFNIAFPGLPRYCPRSTAIRGLNGKLQKVKSGSVVTAILPAVMFDNREWRDPHTFCPHRKEENYLHFGAGQHQCLGQELSLIIVEEMVIQFLNIEQVENIKIIKTVNDGPTYDAVYAYMESKTCRAKQQ